jgi:hypothetical protein
MIAKAKAVQHTGQSIAYGMREGEEIDRNYVLGETAEEISADFNDLQKYNERCTNNTISIVVSPTVEDGKKLKTEDWKQIVKDQLDGMGLDSSKRQYVAYLHKNKEHKHLHIYANRIDENGKAFNDKFIGKNASSVAEKIAQNREMKTANQVKEEKNLIYGFREKKEHVKNENKAILGTVSDLEGYRSKMSERGIEMNFTYDSKEKLRGVTFEFQGETIKGSDVNRNLSGNKIELTIQQERDRELQKQREQSKSRGLGLSL